MAMDVQARALSKLNAIKYGTVGIGDIEVTPTNDGIRFNMADEISYYDIPLSSIDFLLKSCITDSTQSDSTDLVLSQKSGYELRQLMNTVVSGMSYMGGINEEDFLLLKNVGIGQMYMSTEDIVSVEYGYSIPNNTMIIFNTLVENRYIELSDFDVFEDNSVKISNDIGIVYIKGDEDQDGSTRIQASDDNVVVAQEKVGGIWFDGSIRGNIIFAGKNSALSSVGDKLMVTSGLGDDRFILVQSKFDDDGTKSPETPIMSEKSIRVISQPDDSYDMIGNTVQYTVTPSTTKIIDKIYYKTGSVDATSDILWTAYPTNFPDCIYVKRLIPKEDWVANTELEFDFQPFGLTAGVSFTGKLECVDEFHMAGESINNTPWRGSDSWDLTEESIAYAPPWSAKTWLKDDWCIKGGLIYVCNQDGNQSNSFEANSGKWDLLSALIAKVVDYKGGITVEDFNALTSGANGDEYKLLDSGVLIGGENANSNDTVDITNTFSGRAITDDDYSYFSSPTDVVLQSGRSGGQIINGGIEDNANLVISSTASGTKGFIYIGNGSAVDEGNGNVGVGTITPNDKALVDLTSTTKGLLMPRMTTTQRNAITNPPLTMMVFDTDLCSLMTYLGTWIQV